MAAILRNKKLLLILAMSISICIWILKENYTYYRELDLVYSVAQKVGYTKENSLGIYRSTDNFNYDNIDLVFLSPVTRTEFARSVEQNGFYIVGKYGPSPDYTVWDEMFNITNKSPPRAGSVPMATAWKLSIDNKFVRVRYIDVHTINWTYEGRRIYGNIVIIMLNRR